MSTRSNCWTVVAICTAALLCACTAVRQADPAPDSIQDDLRSGELVSVGDKVAVVTADGREMVFRVVKVDDAAVYGDDVVIAIDDISSVEVDRPPKREFDPLETALTAYTVVSTVYVAVAILWLLSIY